MIIEKQISVYFCVCVSFCACNDDDEKQTKNI